MLLEGGSGPGSSCMDLRSTPTMVQTRVPTAQRMAHHEEGFPPAARPIVDLWDQDEAGPLEEGHDAEKHPIGGPYTLFWQPHEDKQGPGWLSGEIEESQPDPGNDQDGESGGEGMEEDH